MDRGFTIQDGYQEPAYIAAVPGLHPELRIVYRPMLVAERDTIESSRAGKTAAMYRQVLAAAVANRLVSWSAVDADGKPLACDAATTARLRPALADKLYAVIAGDRASDPDPQAGTERQNQEADQALTAAIEGRRVADVRQEDAEKN